MSSETKQVLDHGYLKLIETYGADARIVEAARMSTQKGFLGWGPRCKNCGRPLGGESQWITCPNEDCEDAGVESGDEKLLEYLWKNKHATPFEFAGMIIEVQAPIFVFREWHRHRTQSYNEMSARYAPLPDLNYMPTIERLMLGGGHLTKQAGAIAGAAVLTEENARQEQLDLEEEYAFLEQRYQRALSRGVPKELARVRLPVGRYSRMRAATCLRNWLAFLTLRRAPYAQWEIRQYANALHGLLTAAFPRTLALFDGGE